MLTRHRCVFPLAEGVLTTDRTFAPELSNMLGTKSEGHGINRAPSKQNKDLTQADCSLNLFEPRLGVLELLEQLKREIHHQMELGLLLGIRRDRYAIE